MKSRIELEIDAPQQRVAELFADPANNLNWMDDLARIEPVSGKLGEVGSVYRMVPKQGPAFLVTVVERKLPEALKLSLASPGISVAVSGRLLKVSESKTRLLSEETFEFDGMFNKVSGFLAQKALKAVHRRHMNSFKRFAESRR